MSLLQFLPRGSCFEILHWLLSVMDCATWKGVFLHTSRFGQWIDFSNRYKTRAWYHHHQETMSWGRKVCNSQHKNTKGGSMCSLSPAPSLPLTGKNHELVNMWWVSEQEKEEIIGFLVLCHRWCVLDAHSSWLTKLQGWQTLIHSGFRCIV